MRANAGASDLGRPQKAGGLGLNLAAVQPPARRGRIGGLQAKIRDWSLGQERREALLGVGRQAEMRGSRHYVSLVRYEGRDSAPLPGVRAGLSVRLDTHEHAGPASSQAWLRYPASWIRGALVPGAHTGRVQTSADKRIQAVF